MKKLLKYILVFTLIISFIILSSCNSNAKEIKKLHLVGSGELIDLEDAKVSAKSEMITVSILDEEDNENSIIDDVELKYVKDIELKVYEIGGNMDNEVQSIKDAFEMNDVLAEYEEDYELYAAENKVLKVYHNGTIHYTNYPENREDYPIYITNEEARYQAEQFLNEWGLLPNDFSYSGVGDGKITVEGEENSTVHQKLVMFSRNIDGIPVVGNSHIYVVITSYGVSEVSIAYKKYTSEKVIKPKSFNKALNEIKGQESNVFISKNGASSIDEMDTAKEISIEKTSFVYVEFGWDSEQTHIQPAYRFVGDVVDVNNFTYDISALVVAVPDSYTYD